MYDDDKPGEINKSPGLFFFENAVIISLLSYIWNNKKK